MFSPAIPLEKPIPLDKLEEIDTKEYNKMDLWVKIKYDNGYSEPIKVNINELIEKTD